MPLTIYVKEKENFTKSEEKKLQSAIKILDQTINSTLFKERVLNHKYRGKKTFVDNFIIKNERKIELSNKEIYEHFMSGADRSNWKADNRMDLKLAVSSNKCSDTIGYTTKPSNKITTYRCHLSRFEPYQYAAHLAHEYCHCAGFGHDEESTEPRPFSVPYGIGKIIRRIAQTASLIKESESLFDIEIIAQSMPEIDFDTQEESFNESFAK